MPPMTTHCVLLLCGAGCLPVIASSYVRSGTKPPDKDLVNCPARAEPHSPQQKEHYRVLPFHHGFWYCNGCEMFFACQRSFGYVLVSSEVSHRIAAIVSRSRAYLACTFRLTTNPMQYFKGGCGPLRRMCHTP